MEFLEANLSGSRQTSWYSCSLVSGSLVLGTMRQFKQEQHNTAMPSFMHVDGFTIFAKATFSPPNWRAVVDVVADAGALLSRCSEDLCASKEDALAEACIDAATLANYIAWKK